MAFCGIKLIAQEPFVIEIRFAGDSWQVFDTSEDLRLQFNYETLRLCDLNNLRSLALEEFRKSFLYPGCIAAWRVF